MNWVEAVPGRTSLGQTQVWRGWEVPSAAETGLGKALVSSAAALVSFLSHLPLPIMLFIHLLPASLCYQQHPKSSGFDLRARKGKTLKTLSPLLQKELPLFCPTGPEPGSWSHLRAVWRPWSQGWTLAVSCQPLLLACLPLF